MTQLNGYISWLWYFQIAFIHPTPPPTNPHKDFWRNFFWQTFTIVQFWYGNLLFWELQPESVPVPAKKLGYRRLRLRMRNLHRKKVVFTAVKTDLLDPVSTRFSARNRPALGWADPSPFVPLWAARISYFLRIKQKVRVIFKPNLLQYLWAPKLGTWRKMDRLKDIQIILHYRG